MSSQARAILKRGLTKSHSRNRHNNPGAKLIDDSFTPMETSAPRVLGSVNSTANVIIHDGDCTPCIISYTFALKLGLQDELEPTNPTLIIGDGSGIFTKDVTINVTFNVAIIFYHALCLNVEDEE